ncbi:MAG TPA: asparagine synthase-related protein [Candidatus Acidoferrum sp.]
MSGFAGIVRIAPSPESDDSDRSAMECMARAIAFRGPDFQQQTRQPGVSFAFSLLVTGPAPQSDSLPVTLDGKVWLIGDVRLDRRRELLDSLKLQGQLPRTDITDEEIVLLAWKLWREAGIRRIFFEDMHGDFGFALWEPGTRELHCFRDAMGGRAFYYCAKEGVLSFSNTLDALHHAPGATSELDREFVGDFLLHSWCPRPEHTVYKSIRRLPAGHWLSFSPNGTSVRRFQELPIEEPLFLQRQEEYVELYRDLLRSAVADRLPRSSAAIFLSGGMDSSTIAATVCSLRKQAGAGNGLHAVSADMQPLFDDEEGQWAAKVAEHLGIDFQLSHHGHCIPFSGFGGAPNLLPEPLANPFRATYLHLYSQCTENSRVVFMGYGGDDILTGQTGAYLAYLAGQGKLRTAAASLTKYIISNRSLPPLRTGAQAWFRRRIGLVEPELRFPSWLEPRFEQEFDFRRRWEELQLAEQPKHPIHPSGYRGLTGTFWPQALDNEDAAFIGLPLEVRTPLFDYRLLRFLLRLPSLPWCVNKKIMRTAMQDELPVATLRRRKSPLVHDPLLLQIKKGLWHFDVPLKPSPEIREFVNWAEFSRHVQDSPDSAGWSHVPPIALNLWLKGIETH